MSAGRASLAVCVAHQMIRLWGFYLTWGMACCLCGQSPFWKPFVTPSLTYFN